MATHYVYIVECSDGTLYTGYTTDPARRVAEHNAGQGAKYTRGRGPVRLRHAEAHPTRPAALRREAEIKAWPRRRKLALIQDGDGA